jgi:hypothetical protein
MEHLAMLDNGDDPSATTTWLEEVTDDETCPRPRHSDARTRAGCVVAYEPFHKG